MIDQPSILQAAVRSAALVRITTPRAKIREVMGPGLQELHAALQAQGVAPAGPWFTYHPKMMPDVFEFDIGIPVDQAVAPTGRVRMGQLPMAKVARTILRGSYENLPVAWPELDAWIVAQGQKPGPALWETYLIGPEVNPDPASWRTELTRPLVSA
jgi:effector-binding domain-containing protein